MGCMTKGKLMKTSRYAQITTNRYPIQRRLLQEWSFYNISYGSHISGFISCSIPEMEFQNLITLYKPFSSLSITTDRVPPYSHHTLSSSQHTPLSNKQNKNNNCGQLRMFPSSVHSLACTHSIPSISHFPSSFIQDTKPSSTVSDDSASAVEHGIFP